MRAVWSFWSKPFFTATGWPWREPIHHWLAWGLSVSLARSHYPETMLVTDTRGKALLVDALGLGFNEVSTELDQLKDADPSLWMLGKLMAYAMQDKPFVHLDTDVFLWRPLPREVADAPVFAQHQDVFPVGMWSGPRAIEDAFSRAELTLPAEWEWVRSHSRRWYREPNCGILGGTNTGFLRYYARLSLELALDPAHAGAWSSIPNRAWLNPTIEQFVLNACIDYHRFHPRSEYRGIYQRYLFPSAADAFTPGNGRRAGYTHLLGDAKQHPVTTARLAARISAEDPAFYARCEALIGDQPLPCCTT